MMRGQDQQVPLHGPPTEQSRRSPEKQFTINRNETSSVKGTVTGGTLRQKVQQPATPVIPICPSGSYDSSGVVISTGGR